jgi:predicted acetyltransferase
MRAELESVVEVDVPIALLVAAEWPIYGRFGYGPAVEACGFEIDARTARFTTLPTGSIALVEPAGLRRPLEAAHDARWRRTMGAITRNASTWDRLSGIAAWPGDKAEPGQRRGAVWRDADGQPQGAVAYSVHDSWTRNRPDGRIEVSLLVGATPEAERELWRHLCEVDWVSTVAAGVRGLDDPLPFFLHDARAAAALDRSDCIWARILDLPRVIAARRSAVPGSVVVEVVDELGPAGGRWALELGPDGASATSTDRTAEVRLPVATLGAACLGGASLTRLHQAGWMDEDAPGAVARLDALLRAPIAPWAPTTF